MLPGMNIGGGLVATACSVVIRGIPEGEFTAE